MLSSSCLRGVITWRGEDNDDLWSSFSSIFHRNDKGQKKKTQRWQLVLLSSMSRGARIGGSEDDNDLWLLWLLWFSIFPKSDKSQKEKTWRQWHLCLRGVKTRGGEDDDDLWSLSSFVFHKSNKGQKKNTQRQRLMLSSFVFERSENKRRRRQ